MSSTLDAAEWSNTTFIRSVDEVAALKRRSGKDIYLVGGATTVSGFLEAGLVDELRLIVHPLVAGDGGSLFATTTGRHRFTLRTADQLPGGRVSLVYELEEGAPGPRTV